MKIAPIFWIYKSFHLITLNMLHLIVGQFKSGELLICSWEYPHLLGMVFIYLGVLDLLLRMWSASFHYYFLNGILNSFFFFNFKCLQGSIDYDGLGPVSWW